MAGRQIQADRHRQPTARAIPSAISTQIQGVVNSVDLTQSPPLLSIDGQTYTINQIKSIVELIAGTVRAAAQLARAVHPFAIHTIWLQPGVTRRRRAEGVLRHFQGEFVLKPWA